jgi:hypothetical protein
MHVLVLGLSAGVWAQGGYHGPGRLVLVVAVSAAVRSPWSASGRLLPS